MNLIHLLRHGSLPRDNDGAIEFWRIKEHLQDHFVYCHHWSDAKWKSSMAGGEGHKKIFQYCADSSGTTLYLRALQGHSGRVRITVISSAIVIERARSTSAQPDERQLPAGPAKRDRKERSGQLGTWPDIPPTWELELDVRRHTETKTKLLTRSVHVSDSGIEIPSIVMRWLQPTQENTETVHPSFCPCFKHLSGYFPGCWDETRCVGPWEGALKPNIGIPYAERSDETRESNVRNDVKKGSGCRNSSLLWKHAISYTVHWTTHHEVQDPSVGHKSDGWHVMYLSAPPSIVAPGDRRLPTIISISDMSRRRTTLQEARRKPYKRPGAFMLDTRIRVLHATLAGAGAI